MIGAFFFVTVCSVRNRVRVAVRRLREPRYLASAVAGLAYMWFAFLRRMTSRRTFAKIPQLMQLGDLGRDAVSLVALAALVLPWGWPGDSGGIEFAESELHFLLTAPVSRRQMLLYKLFRALPGLLFSAAFMAFMGFRQSMGIGIIAAFGALTIYTQMVGQARARLRLAGMHFLIRMALVAGVAVLLGWFIVGQLGTSLDPALHSLRRSQAGTAIDAVDAPFRTPAMRALLFVPHFFANAIFPRDVLMLAGAVLGLIALSVASFLIAAKLNVSFEEASIAASAKRAARLERMRSQRQGQLMTIRRLPPPFRLRDTGFPELAIVWKNLVAAVRMAAPILLLTLLPLVLLAVKGMTHTYSLDATRASIALFLAGMFPLIGTTIFAQDLRLDLPRIELLKSYPIAGERLVAAELAAPLGIVAIVELILVSVASYYSTYLDGMPFTLVGSPQFVVLAMLFTIPIVATQLVIRNAFPLYFPAWAFRSKESPRGIAATGQRLLMLLGNVIVLTLAVAPAGLVVIPGLWAATHFAPGNPVALAAATMPGVALLVFEVWLGIKLLGAQYDKLDATNDFDPSSA